MPDALPPVLTGASARWRFTSTKLLEGDPGPNTWGEHEQKDTYYIPQLILLVTLELDDPSELSTVGMRGQGFIPLLGSFLGYRLSAEET